MSCSKTPNELKIVEKIMEEHPDSALQILQKLPPEKYSSDASRALFGILLFQALDKNYLPLQPDSLINFSIDYYLKQKDEKYLAIAYFYKGRKLYSQKEYEKATKEFLSSIENCTNNTNNLLLGKNYSDLAAISFMQKENIEARKKYLKASSIFNKAKRPEFVLNEFLNIGQTYVVEKKYNIARLYYKKVYLLSTDSFTLGTALAEIGTSYYKNDQYDSSLYYYKQSFTYPIREGSLAIRYYTLAGVFYNISQYDSASFYALKSMKYPAGFHVKKECCRIVVNAAYNRKDMKTMNKYMSKYQECTDSVRVIESQTKAVVIEKQHNSKTETAAVKQNLTLYTLLLTASILIILIIGVYLYHRNKLRKQQIENCKLELDSKQVFVSQSISTKIEELKSIQTKTRRNAQPDDRLKLSKELYNNALHIDNWDVFSSEMNHAFNNIVDKLHTDHPALSRKEISWCCLHLLDISNVDRVLLLETTTEGLYKLKQRIAQKLNLVSTKELDTYLRNKAASRN
ncbi:MAG: hypothetical protein JZU53_10005 [Paludibacter sp.]|nr:hypothetical protein [Paludibacter sp.]